MIAGSARGPVTMIHGKNESRAPHASMGIPHARIWLRDCDNEYRALCLSRTKNRMENVFCIKLPLGVLDVDRWKMQFHEKTHTHPPHLV